MDEELEGDEELEIVAPPAEIASGDIVMLLLSVPERISDIVLGLTPAQLGYRHGPAFPTAEEVVAHVATTGSRLDATITAISLDTPATESEPSHRSLGEQLEDWQRQRRRSVDLLRGLPPEGWEKAVGDVELIDHCRQELGHELGHLTQLRNLTALLPIA